MPRAPGGKRSKAGRKPKPETVLKRMEQEFRIKEAEKSFRFVCDARDNKSIPWGIRLAAAQDVQDRVFGKPKQQHELSGSVTLEQLLTQSSEASK